jgi:hypothetical protein
MSGQRAFHVTERETAALILKEGFLGGWGDVGFGVYFWTNETVCRAYAKHGGWDGLMTDPVVLEVHDPSLIPIDLSSLPSGWNPELYASMLWRPMEGDDPDRFWRPEALRPLDAPDPEPGL